MQSQDIRVANANKGGKICVILFSGRKNSCLKTALKTYDKTIYSHDLLFPRVLLFGSRG